MTAAEALRADLRLLADFVPPGARVLDLGCGDGALLAFLRDERGCAVRGIEISPQGVLGCVRRGIPVIQANLDEGLRDIPDDSFDVVVLSQTLQEVRHLRPLIAETARVGRRAIISYPNFGLLSARIRLGIFGRMPVSDALPYQWYDTPNVHYTTIRDFRLLAQQAGLEIEREVALRLRGDAVARVHLLPNLRAELAVTMLRRPNE
ncbi:MAG: methionine biosynthesis protein MetW [Actinobacteria bacterium]|nr:methionine biosynthesis protein MetW [Actinomycetota bacterium]